MNITDLIADTLTKMLEEQDGSVQIQRNDLALRLGCVPSQINYVITSRFTQAQGYIVESRRGGGGFVRIVKVDNSKSKLILHIINSIGDFLDEHTAVIIINSLCLDGRLTEEEAVIMRCVVSENNFKGLEDESRRIIRANLLKSMLLASVNR